MKKIIMLAASLLVCIASCKIYSDPDPIFEDDAGSKYLNKRRVLVINVDGAIGKVVQSVMPPNISSLLSNSKYTFSSIIDGNTGYGPTWATLAKGVSLDKHGILRDEFSNATDANQDNHNSVAYYPSFFYRLQEISAHYKHSVILRDSLLAVNLFNEVENSLLFKSDESLVQHAEEYLKTTKDVLCLVQLSEVMEAGRATGFTIDNPDYVQAINNVDGYIGKMVNSIKERPNYSQEDWLIIVQSNNGGYELVTGGSDFYSKNRFVILHNPKFKSYEFETKLIDGVEIFKSGPSSSYVRNGLVVDNADAYNVETDGFTAEFLFKFNNNDFKSVSNAFVLGKSTTQNHNRSQSNGWFFYNVGRVLQLQIYYDDGTAINIANAVPEFRLGQWEHVAFTIQKQNTDVTIKIYVNGNMRVTRTATLSVPTARIISSTPFRMQFGLEHNSAHTLRFTYSDLRFFNQSLSEDDIKRHACLPELDASDPNYQDLIGYYPLKSDFNNVIIPGTNNLVPMLHNNAPILPIFSRSIYRNICINNSFKDASIENIEIAPLIFYWLRKDFSKFGWSQVNVLKYFELEFLGKDNEGL